MGDFPHYFDIILFAMVAAFLVLRLRSVLGRRTGNERRRNNPLLRQAEPTGDKVIAFGQRANGAATPPPATEAPGDAVAARVARVTLKLVSDQINVVRAHDGSIVDGDPDHPIEKTDFWSFARDTRSTDPNWVLVATNSG